MREVEEEAEALILAAQAAQVVVAVVVLAAIEMRRVQIRQL